MNQIVPMVHECGGNMIEKHSIVDQDGKCARWFRCSRCGEWIKISAPE